MAGSKIGQGEFPVWDEAVHGKKKFYMRDENFVDKAMHQEFKPLYWKRISEISLNP